MTFVYENLGWSFWQESHTHFVAVNALCISISSFVRLSILYLMLTCNQHY